MRINLTNSDKFITIDDEDYLRISLYNWRACGGSRYGDGFTTVVSTTKTPFRLANYIMGDELVTYDHKDRNPFNFQKSNLRIATKSQNEANKPKQDRAKECSSQYKGVNKLPSGKYMAKITLNKKQMYLGSYKNEVDAAKAYNAAALKYFGEFAHLNVVEVVQSN